MKLINTVKKIIQEETEFSLNLRRRLGVVDSLIDMVVHGSYVCDFDSPEQFVEAVVDELSFSYERFFNRLDLSKEETLRFLRKHRTEKIMQMYSEMKKGCK